MLFSSQPQTKGGSVNFGSVSDGTVHLSREGLVAGPPPVCGDGSITMLVHILVVQEPESSESWYMSYFLSEVCLDLLGDSKSSHVDDDN